MATLGFFLAYIGTLNNCVFVIVILKLKQKQSNIISCFQITKGDTALSWLFQFLCHNRDIFSIFLCEILIMTKYIVNTHETSTFTSLFDI